MPDSTNNTNKSSGIWPGVLRITIGVLLLLLSLLNIFPAPIFLLWLAAIIINEYGVYLAVFSSVLLIAGLRIKRFRNTGTYILLVAILLFMVPVFEAIIAASDFPVDFEYQFPVHNNLQEHNGPLIFSSLFKIRHENPVPFTTYVYTQTSNRQETLDFYPPDQHVYSKSGSKDVTVSDTSLNQSLRPCVLIIHGGSWSGGNSQQLPELNSALAERGYAVASMNYGLAPAIKSPAPVQDVKVALAYLTAHATELHIDTNNIVLLGRSAGAQIALLSAYTFHNKNIRGVIDFYGPADMIWGYSKPSNPLVLNSRKVMEDYLGGTFSQVPENFRQSSPIEFASISSPPTLILHGGNDVLVAFEHSRRLNNKLHQLGVRHYLLALPWATHGFDYNLNGPGGQLSTNLVERFLASVFTVQKPM